MNAADTLSVSSPVFAPDGTIPLCCTGFGEDVSPPLHLSGLCKGAVSLAVTMWIWTSRCCGNIRTG